MWREVEPEPLGDGYVRLVGTRYTVIVALLDQVADAERDDFIRLFTEDRGKIKDPKALRWVQAWITKARTMPELTRAEEIADIIEGLIESLGADEVLRYIDPERRLAGLDPDEVLRHIDPERRLAGLDPDEVLRHIDPERRLAGLDPDEVLRHYDAEQRLASLDPEQIARHLDPGQIARYLDPEQRQKLRAALDDELDGDELDGDQLDDDQLDGR